jgi:GNAT superfamily N-acetyltransferase
MDTARDAPGIVELIDEVFPSGVTTVESWRQQHENIPPRARQAGWVAVVDGTVVGRAEASLKWFTESRSAFAGVSVRQAFRGRGIGSSLWELIREHLDELAPSRVFSMFVETPESVAFARARGFAEIRAETLSCVDPLTVDFTTLEAASTKLIPLRDVSPEEVYEIDMITTADVPMTEAITDIPLDEWLDSTWNRPTLSRDGSFAAIEDGRIVCMTMLAANVERGRAFTDFTATLREYRRRGLAHLVKRASLRWAAANGIRAAWTTNDETNAAMLAVNRRLGYTPELRRVEYVREASGAEAAS